MNDPATIRRLYGRRQGHKLRAGQASLAEELMPGGRFRLGTDDPTYCRWALMVMGQREDFRWTAERPRDFLERPADWPETRYERKARRHGHEVWYFNYLRR